MIAQKTETWDVRKARQAAKLESGLENSLSAYAIAAVSAGVSLLAMTKSAEAKIIYTPANTSIPVSNKQSVVLDLNHDGIADFSFWNLTYGFSEGQFRVSLNVGCAAVPVSQRSSTCRYKANEIWGKGVSFQRFASALRPGFEVGANRSFFQQVRKRNRTYVRGPLVTMAGYGGADTSGFPNDNTWGQWFYTNHRYLGLQFMIGGQLHYGWARVAVALDPTARGVQVTLTGYAYETIPNKPIVTGKTKGPDVITLEPASLGRLAQGASGVSAWREKK